MGRYSIIFVITALVLIGIIKILAITTFDANKYGKQKTTQYSNALKQEKSIKKINKKYKQSDTTRYLVVNKKKIISPPTPQQEYINLKNNYLMPYLASLKKGELRDDVVVRYYGHKKDSSKVYSLNELGYYIHIKKAKETKELGSNVLLYGKNVKIEDIKIIAFTLIKNGLPLKKIQPTQFNWKLNSLEIGTDKLLLDKKIITFQDIQNFSK